MLRLAATTLRGRWPALVGAFAALAVGAALVIGAVSVIVSVQRLGVDKPQRYAGAPVVVAHAPQLEIPVGRGADRELEIDPNLAHAPLDPALATQVAALPGVEQALVDRTFPVRLPARLGGSGAPAVATVGHPWSASAMTPYGLVEGRAPAAPDEVAATTGGPAARLSATRTLVTPAGPAPYRVVGIVAPRGDGPAYEQPLFFSDAEAARLAPQVDAIAVWPRAAAPAVSQLLAQSAPGIVALTGSARGKLEPNAERDAVEAGNTLLGLMAATVGFVAVFVIASTFAFAVALRRRELGLLRAIGATPRQVRRLVLREAGLIACVAAVIGGAGSLAVGPLLGAWLTTRGLAPTGLHVSPSAAAVLLGAAGMIAVALVGAWLAARRASRVRPAEALRDAAIDRGVMTKWRWALGLASLGGAAVLMAQPVPADAGAQLGVALGEGALLIVGLTMLSPLLVPRLVALLVLPLSFMRGAGPLLARQQARAAVRRTSSTAAPVLVVVGLAAAMAMMVGTISASDRAASKVRFAPTATVVTAPDDANLSEGDLAALRAVPGAQVGATLDAYLRTLGAEGIALNGASGIEPEARGLVLRMPAIHGSPDRLTGTTIALGELAARGFHKRVGDTVEAWFPDGTPTPPLRVVAVMADGFSMTGMYVPRSLLAGHVDGTAATAAYVRLPRGDAAGQKALRTAVAAHGLTMREATSARRVADVTDSSNMNGRALQMILGVAILYVAIALASTAAVGTVARAGELARLRLCGATPRQIVRLVAGETVVVAAAGALLGLGAAGAMLLGMRRGLDQLHGPSVVTMPWAALLALSAGCTVVAVIAAVLAARRSQARPPHVVANAGGA